MASAASRPTTGRPCPGSSGPSKGDGYARLNLGSLCADGTGVPRDWQRARSLFVKATLSPDPRVARKANENLSAMPHQSPPARDRDDTTAAVVGTALVGLALLAIFSGSDEAGGSGAGGARRPPRARPSVAAPRRRTTSPTRPDPPRPMVGNIGKSRMGEEGRDPPVVGR